MHTKGKVGAPKLPGPRKSDRNRGPDKTSLCSSPLMEFAHHENFLPPFVKVRGRLFLIPV